MLRNNLNLAQELGAEVMSTIDEDIISGLMRVAGQKNITQIIVGKPLRVYVTDFFYGGNLVERLLKVSGDIEIHIVSQPNIFPAGKNLLRMFKFRTGISEYAAALASVAVITLINYVLSPFVGYWSIALIYLLYVLLLGLVVGRGAVFFAATVSSLAWNFLFIPPLYTMRIDKLEDLMMFLMYFITATVVGALTSKLRSKEWALKMREKKISEMYAFSKALENASGTDDVAATTVKYIEEYFSIKAALILRDETGKLLSHEHPCSSFEITSSGRGCCRVGV